MRATESTSAGSPRAAAERQPGKTGSATTAAPSVAPSRRIALQAYVDASPGLQAQRATLQSTFGASFQARPAVPIQRKVGFEYEMTDINTRRRNFFGNGTHPHDKGYVLRQFPGFQLTADVDVNGASQLEVIIKEIDETDANEVLNLVTHTAPGAVGAINAIAASNAAAAWTRANQIAGVGGSGSDEYRFLGNGAANIVGQLQMTGGIDPAKLLDHLTGAQAQNYLATLAPVGANADDDAARGTLGPYEPVAVGGGLAVGPHAAVAVNGTGALNALTQAERDHLAGIVALMATIPVTARSAAGILPYAKSAAGAHLARTDFSRMLKKLSNPTKAALTPADMRQIVLTTINAALPPPGGVVIGDPVFPAGAVAGGGANLDALTIQDWVNDALPTVGFFGGYNKGVDRLTKKHFPGGKAEKAQMESLGSYGKKLDPGDFPILEFRTLTGVVIGELTEQLRRLLAFINH
ncbi:hypothetical protein [Roseateles sp.]|uniref:hypothetical protein n=1 Tax=Roseateles sp. TaxID=1971397 RepID=UPI002F3E7341